MQLFTDLYFRSTDPTNSYSVLLSFDVILSVLFHSFLYLIIIYVIGFLFNFKFKNTTYYKIFATLIIVMTIGYFYRMNRVKNIYYYYIHTGLQPDEAKKLTYDLINIGYFRYYFLA